MVEQAIPKGQIDKTVVNPPAYGSDVPYCIVSGPTDMHQTKIYLCKLRTVVPTSEFGQGQAFGCTHEDRPNVKGCPAHVTRAPAKMPDDVARRRRFDTE